MFLRLGQFVSRHWLMVILGWVAIVVALRSLAPAWDDVTQDGDLAYLPAEMPSVVGEQLLSKGFPENRPKSQIAFFVIRDGDVLNRDDVHVAHDLARRLKNLHAVAAFSRGKTLAEQAEHLKQEGRLEESERKRSLAEGDFDKAMQSLNEAIRLDENMAEYEAERAAKDEVSADHAKAPRLSEIYYNRHLLHAHLGNADEAAADLKQAVALDASLAAATGDPLPQEAATLPLLDVWTWLDDIFGKKLGTKSARLVMLQLSNEFMATDNIRVLDYLEGVLEPVRATVLDDSRDSLKIGFSGSAAVGGDLLRSAKDSIKNTELFTVLLVVLILGLVYRSPLLIAMPLVTISISLFAATAIVAMLTQVGAVPGFDWWNFKVFTTTRIFIVVILFGAGTDYFLFLVARYKEELQRGLPPAVAIAQALAGVGDALAASALTTILGLGTMFFADFGKFSNSGPAIAMCLAVTLIACITLAPALLRAFGPAVFWPFGVGPIAAASAADAGKPTDAARTPGQWFWERMAYGIIRYPGLILTASIFVLLPLAYHGAIHGKNMTYDFLQPWPQAQALAKKWGTSGVITYDFLRQLPADRPSRQGAELMARHFPVGESGPVQVVAFDPDGRFDTKEGREQIRDLTALLYLDDVVSVRSITDPLGDFPPGRRIGMTNIKSWVKLVTSAHPRTQELFVATSGELAGKVTRLDVLLSHDPFSPEASATLERIEAYLKTFRDDPDSPWQNATFAYAGTIAGIRDLKLITQSDNIRIQILVVLAVLAVLLAILKRPLICCYLILTVLFSYFVTLGATELFFAWLDGPEFRGLDWKVPLFLFVILVAIGQDYNVYLTTRVFEEQERLGPVAGLRQAVVKTGGIITSCGVIMAGTFSAMTSGEWGRFVPAWLPGVQQLFGGNNALPAIVQLGFALTLGVMLDTFVVRPILVPAFLALLCRWRGERISDGPERKLDEDSRKGPHRPRSRGEHLRATV
jgi:putative drug exporter of the RND superfamily